MHSWPDDSKNAGDAMSEERAFLCSICFKPVIPSQCKIDEDGRPIHEHCYAERLLYLPPKKNVRSEQRWWGNGNKGRRVLDRS